MSDSDITLNRRTVLKRASVGAAVGALAATGSATATVSSEELQDIKTQDCDCSYQYTCERESCYDGQYSYDYTEYRKECCTCDGETVCEDSWSRSGCCPFRES